MVKDDPQGQGGSTVTALFYSSPAGSAEPLVERVVLLYGKNGAPVGTPFAYGRVLGHFTVRVTVVV